MSEAHAKSGTEKKKDEPEITLTTDQKFRALSTILAVVGLLALASFIFVGISLSEDPVRNERLRDLEEAVRWLYCNEPMYARVDCKAWHNVGPHEHDPCHFLNSPAGPRRESASRFPFAKSNWKTEVNVPRGDKGDPGCLNPGCVPYPTYPCPVDKGGPGISGCPANPGKAEL
jgi:hypothetical protein